MAFIPPLVSAIAGAGSAVAGTASALAPVLTIGGAAVQGFSSYRAGKFAKEEHKEAAAEERRQAQFGQQMALEEKTDLLMAGEEAKSRVRTSAAGKGLRLGGSVKAQINAISERVRRRQHLINLQTSEQMRRSDVRSRRFLKAGRRAMKAGRYSAYGSLLTAGAAFGKQLSEAGWFSGGSKFSGTSHIGGYRPGSGYGLK